MKIFRVLISVSNKDDLISLVRPLEKYGAEFIASEGTASFLREQGYSSTSLATITGQQEAFQGRIKTISFALASSLLFRRESERDREQAKELGIRPIDLVVCNLYPFVQLLQQGEKSEEELVENIDIGGVLLLRASAKNYRSVAVLTHPRQYRDFLIHLEENGGETTLPFRQQLAQKAFALTASYDQAIAGYFRREEAFGPLHGIKKPLRYGENPGQKGWAIWQKKGEGLAGTSPIQGKELSYNNLLDGNAAWRACQDLSLLHFGPSRSSGG